MMKHFAIVVLWCLLNTSVAHGCENVSRADETVRALRQKLRISNIGQVHVFFVPYDRLPVIAVSPSALERSWEIQINPAKSLECVPAWNKGSDSDLMILHGGIALVSEENQRHGQQLAFIVSDPGRIDGG